MKPPPDFSGHGKLQATNGIFPATPLKLSTVSSKIHRTNAGVPRSVGWKLSYLVHVGSEQLGRSRKMSLRKKAPRWKRAAVCRANVEEAPLASPSRSQVFSIASFLPSDQ